MYIYQLKDWPNFIWDADLIEKILSDLRYEQGCLIGGMESIGFQLREEAILQTLTQEVVKSSEIEGELLDQTLVRSSVARQLGMEYAAVHKIDRNIDGVVEMMLDATQHFDEPLTKKRLIQWHSSLFPMGRKSFSKVQVGQWRTGPVEVISGHRGKEKIHFEGPQADQVTREMKVFINWVNKSKLDLVLKAAVGHLWFVTIHPFDDGNGRIARAIADMLLARSEKVSSRFYSLSAQIQAERKDYYSILEKTQKGNLDITDWLKWFLECLKRAIEHSKISLELILKKTKFWESLKDVKLNERQRKVITLLLDHFEGNLTSTKWAKINRCSQDTAYRDILDLMDKKILIRNSSSGRSTSYSLKIPL